MYPEESVCFALPFERRGGAGSRARPRGPGVRWCGDGGIGLPDECIRCLCECARPEIRCVGQKSKVVSQRDERIASLPPPHRDVLSVGLSS